jgi:hypothetical protein
MLQAIINVFFRCRQPDPSRPFLGPVNPSKGTYVACLSCGRQFHYDLKTMRVGRAFPKRKALSGTGSLNLLGPKYSRARQ